LQAVVLAGGLGTRLRAAVPDLPKPMAPIAGRPFLEILLRALAARGVTRAVLSVGYRAEAIVSHFGHDFEGMRIEHAIEDEPLGTGGATRLALGLCDADPVLVTNGDTFLDLDLAALRAAWTGDDVPVLVAREVPDTSRFGRLVVRGDRIVGFAEKGASGPGLINAGTYLVRRDLLAGFQAGARFSLETDVLVPRAATGALRVFVTDGTFIDIGVPEDYARAQTLLARFAGRS
jgi:D-glycero-alpha-D-manno-heptose 1-phosphate guanylyltransferase